MLRQAGVGKQTIANNKFNALNVVKLMRWPMDIHPGSVVSGRAGAKDHSFQHRISLEGTKWNMQWQTLKQAEEEQGADIMEFASGYVAKEADLAQFEQGVEASIHQGPCRETIPGSSRSPGDRRHRQVSLSKSQGPPGSGGELPPATDETGMNGRSKLPRSTMISFTSKPELCSAGWSACKDPACDDNQRKGENADGGFSEVDGM